MLDNGLSGRRTGLDAAPRLKELVPHAKLFMFTAHADLKARADNEPAIDGFVLKTESSQLLALARLAGLSRATFLTPARPRPLPGPYGRRASVPAPADPVVRVDRPRPHRGTSYENVAGQGMGARGGVRKPCPVTIPARVRHTAQPGGAQWVSWRPFLGSASRGWR